MIARIAGAIVSGLLFGALHWLTTLYAMWATLAGVCFALLVRYDGSLATPIAAHATYNLGATV